MRVRAGATAIVALMAGRHVGAYAVGTSVPSGCRDAKDGACAATPAAPLFQTVATQKSRPQLSELLAKPPRRAVKARDCVRTEARMVQIEPGQRLVVAW